MTKFSNAVFSALLGLFVAGCSTISVSHSFDPDSEFTELKRFGWMSGPAVSPEDELALKNIRHSLATQLAGKGIVEDRDNPDFLISIHGGKEKKVDVQQWGYAYADRPYFYRPYGAFGHGYGFAPPPGRIDYRSGTDTFEYEIGTLILDFINPKNKELIWRGTAQAVVEDPVSPQRIDQAVSELLQGFPPSRN